MISIILFFLYCWGFGTGVGLFVRESDDFLERNLMRIGMGLGTFLCFGLVLNLLHVPLDWRIFLFVSVFFMALSAYYSIRKKDFSFQTFKKLNINFYSVLMLAMFFITVQMYASGAFSYPYLEDDDSWSHSLGIKYVSIEKKVFTNEKLFHYIDPYPPAYDMLFGILHQSGDSLYWTMKFFNVLIISLSIIFFYFFARVFTNSNKKALYSTFALFAVPAFLSHFIWAIALVMPLYFVSFYAVEKIRDDKKWCLPALIVAATTLTTSPTHSTYFGLFFLAYFLIRTMIEKKLLIFEFLAGFGGVALSIVLWWLPMLIKYGFKGLFANLGLGGEGGRSLSVLSVGGTGDRIYKLADFIFAQKNNAINNPIGIGLALSALFVIGIVFIIYKYSDELKKNLLVIVPAFLILAAIMTSFLSGTYYGSLWEDKKSDVSFFQFLSSQSFLVILSSVILLILVLLVVASYKNSGFKDVYLAITLSWLLLAFYAVSAGPFYFKISPFRAWMLLAIPVSLIAGEGIHAIVSLVKSVVSGLVNANKIILSATSIIILGLICFSVVKTSFVQKYSVNTVPWGPGGFWASKEEIQGYLWFKESIPKDTKVFTFSNQALIIAFDKFICTWCSDVRDFRKNGFNQSAGDNYDWLKNKEYGYVVFDGETAMKYGTNQTNEKVQSYLNSKKFKVAYSNNNGIILLQPI